MCGGGGGDLLFALAWCSHKISTSNNKIEHIYPNGAEGFGKMREPKRKLIFMDVFSDMMMEVSEEGDGKFAKVVAAWIYHRSWTQKFLRGRILRPSEFNNVQDLKFNLLFN